MSIQHDNFVLTDEFEAFAAVSNLLWTEREILETVLFKLVQENTIISSGSTRWLNRADAELRAALEQMRAAEIIRAGEVEALALQLNLPLDTTLAQLIEVAPEPWPAVLAEHRAVLRSMVHEIEAVTADNRRMLEASTRAIAETLDNLTVNAAGYDASGAPTVGRRASFLLDQSA
jgi:hypothetical protein